MSKYGVCKHCNVGLEPLHSLEAEYKTIRGVRVLTGRTRVSVSHLVCPVCYKYYCTNDTLNERWK